MAWSWISRFRQRWETLYPNSTNQNIGALMKIVIVADCHLNRTSYKNEDDIVFTSLSFRSFDFMKSFQWIVDKILNEIKPDLVVINGDSYDTFHPSNHSMAFFHKQLHRLSSVNIPVFILVGNHEVCQTNHALLSLKELRLSNIKVIDRYQTLPFKGHNLLFFPYTLDVEQGKVTIREDFYKFLEYVDKKVKANSELEKLPSIFFGHFGVKGALCNKYTVKSGDNKVERRVVNTKEGDITCSDLEKIGASYIFLGDYHKHQILDVKNSCAMYSGSIERTDMTEANDEKGFLIYDSEMADNGKYGKCQFIVYPTPRPMVQLTGDYAEICSQVAKLDDSSKGAIVKIKFTGNDENRNEFDSNRKDLDKIIKDKINPIFIMKPQMSMAEDDKKELTEAEQDASDKEHLTDVEVINVVKEIIREKITDKDEVAALIALANEIYISVKG